MGNNINSPLRLLNKTLFWLALFILSYSFCQGQTANLLLTIQGIEQLKGGELKIGIFNSIETFTDKKDPIFEKVLIPNDSVESFTFKKIPSGLYAIAIYHDENGDDILTTKRLGIPVEGVGFSGVSKSKIKPPNFETAAINLTNDSTIFIRLTYPKKAK